MKIILELLDQASSVRRITIRHDIVIGRGSECNLRLSAPQVSRRHCFLRVGRDGISVTDLDSSNGTWVNGSRIPPGTRKELTDGAQVSLGPVRFLLHVRPEAGTDAPSNVFINAKDTAAAGTPSEQTTCAHPVPGTAASDPSSLKTMHAGQQPDWQADDSRAEIIELGRQYADSALLDNQTVLNPQLAPANPTIKRLDSAVTSLDLNLAALGALENADVLDPNVLAGKFPPDRPMWTRDAAEPFDPSHVDDQDLSQNADEADEYNEIEALEEDYSGDDFSDADFESAPEDHVAEPDPKRDDFGPELSAFLKGL